MFSLLILSWDIVPFRSTKDTLGLERPNFVTYLTLLPWVKCKIICPNLEVWSECQLEPPFFAPLISSITLRKTSQHISMIWSDICKRKLDWPKLEKKLSLQSQMKNTRFARFVALFFTIFCHILRHQNTQLVCKGTEICMLKLIVSFWIWTQNSDFRKEQKKNDLWEIR